MKNINQFRKSIHVQTRNCSPLSFCLLFHLCGQPNTMNQTKPRQSRSKRKAEQCTNRRNGTHHLQHCAMALSHIYLTPWPKYGKNNNCERRRRKNEIQNVEDCTPSETEPFCFGTLFSFFFFFLLFVSRAARYHHRHYNFHAESREKKKGEENRWWQAIQHSQHSQLATQLALPVAVQTIELSQRWKLEKKREHEHDEGIARVAIDTFWQYVVGPFV